MPHPEEHVSETRHWARMMEMAKLGAIPGPTPEDAGVNRACLTDLDRDARRLLIGWAEAIGLQVSIDAAANLWLRMDGRNPDAAPVLMGSHMDSQPAGGRFDGIWGVLAGFEALEAIHDAGLVPSRPIELVAWTNEEGGRFAPGCMGSMAWSGHSALSTWDDVRDQDGIRFADALAGHLAAEADLPRRPLGSRPHAYLEAHIEQGPLLEAAGLDVGVVTGIQGSRWFSVTIEGRSAHAGTAPVGLRQDAVQDMVRAIAALNALTADPQDILRFTVARIVVTPNTSNSVAERAVFSIDLRHPDAAVLTRIGDAIAATVAGAMRHCRAEVREHFNAMPATFDADVVAVLEQAAAGVGATQRRMPSGAFHDAQFMIPICPSGMLFVPSRAGVSHNPAEYSSPTQLAIGTRVLTRAVLHLASQN